jgi:putative toxin-antitoxin system antitoxin component (TIGR02293 family)
MSHVIANGPRIRPPAGGLQDALALRSDPQACANLLHNQLEVSFYDELALLIGIPTKRLFTILGVSLAVQRRWRKTQRLTISESDYAFQQASLIQDALELYEGNCEHALNWLLQPNIALNNLTPASLLSTFVGISTVESLIWRIENGVCR